VGLDNARFEISLPGHHEDIFAKVGGLNMLFIAMLLDL
jgi:hypothetical protein